MAHQQSWPLSQDANKRSGTCSSCHAVRQLHLKDGTVHQHGPRGNPCPGSHQLPLSQHTSNSLSASQNTSISFPVPLIVQPTVHTTSHATPLPSSVSVHTSNTPSFTHPTVNQPIIKHIPKSARPACCSALSSLLLHITRSPDNLTAWSNLFNFGLVTLAKPSRGGKRHNLTSVVKKRADDVINNSTYGSSISSSLPSSNKLPPSTRQHDASYSLATKISAKIEDGNVRAAVRIICSDDTLAVANQDTLKKLADKHPCAPSNRSITHIACPTPQLLTTDSEVLKAIRSFPAGSCGGPDGIRPQHIVDLVDCAESGANFVSAITSLVNILLTGNCPAAVQPILFGGNLIALDKKCGGIRPIAIGYVWRRIAAKCANSFALSKLANYFNPLQLGVSVPGGCEAAVHATRRFTDFLPPGSVVAKLDFTNAFNSLHRDAMLAAVTNFIPEIYEFCFLSYGASSTLKFSEHSIFSQEGAQQGDPLGPLLFSLTIHPLLQSLSSALVIGYLDDITLGGSENTVAADVALVQAQGEAIGLKLNITKCEYISDNVTPSSTIFQNFIQLAPSNAMLLGAPLSSGRAMDTSLEKRCEELALAISRLKTLSAHDALTLLRSSFSAPKVMHILRSSSCAGHAGLSNFDALLRSGLSLITNTNFSDMQWLQASLPVKDGGLGVRRVTSLASSAFLASAASTLGLQELILSRCSPCPDASVSTISNNWSATYNLPSLCSPLSASQKAWDRPSIDADKTSITSCAPDNHHRARLLAVSAPHAGDWLHALPISNCGLRLDDEAIRVAVGLRLGINLCQPHPCPCGAQVDARGTHGLSCRQSSGRTSRHHYLNDLVWRALTRAGIPSSKEPSGLSRSDGKRPDGMTMIPWQTGKSLIWDVTVADTLAASHLSITSRQAAAAAENASDRKEVKYSELARSFIFVPIAFETLGPIGRKASDFLSDLGRRISLVSGNPRESSFLFQRISVAMQRFNGVCFKGSFIPPPDTES